MGWHVQALPSPISDPPRAPVAAQLRAGVGRADITVPPGVALAGSGPESRSGTGYRQRLYARALVLEDRSGERLAVVVADLPHFSANLHRLVADRILATTGIGADRLIISATHNHSAAGNYYADKQYNQNTARLAGYDPHIVEFMVSGMTDAVLMAFHGLAPAKLAWGSTFVVGVTRNRSLAAYCRNPEAGGCHASASGDSLAYHAIDTTMVMLRIERVGPAGVTRPIGAFTIFAMHGTVNPSVNTLVDADVHGIVERQLEHHIESSWPEPHDPMAPGAVHLFANSAEGDVSPAWSAQSRCPPPIPGRIDPLLAPRGPGETWDFVAPAPAVAARCVALALADMKRIGGLVSDSVIALFDRLGAALQDTFTIRRAFATMRLPGTGGLCGSPVVGSGTGGGSEDAVTRVRGWRYLIWPWPLLAFEEGGRAIDAGSHDCQSPKRTLMAPLQQVIIGPHGLPDAVQFTVVRVGSLVLAAVPVEATTVVGMRWRDALVAGATRAGWPATRAAIIGLANGYLQYVPTAEEYALQHYEGASALYGPASDKVFGDALRALAEQLPVSAGTASPPVSVPALMANPGKPSRILPIANDAAATPLMASQLTATCHGGRVIATWTEAAFGARTISLGPRIAFDAERTGSWQRVAWDDQIDVTVEAVTGARPGRQTWRATWRFGERPRPFNGRVQLLRAPGDSTPLVPAPFVCKTN